MTDRDLIKAELQNLQKILEDKADMCIGAGKMKLLSFANACSGALELLKEQEPRALTLDEVLSQAWDYCYIEAQVRPHSKMLEMLCGTHRLYCTTSTVLERQNRGDKEYGKTWRCWNTRPTDEQRKATPWNEPPKEVEG